MLVPDPFGPGGERVKVLDFGIAALFSGGRADGPADPLIMGTPMYMSPEQCHGADAADEKTDVYSLGTVLFEMLAGRPPFVGDAATDLVGMHLFRPPPSLHELAPDAPLELVTLVERLLIKDKALRPAMFEVATILGDMAAAVDTTSAHAVIGPPPAAVSSLMTGGTALVSAPPRRPAIRSWQRLISAGLLGAIIAGSFLFLVKALPEVAARRRAQLQAQQLATSPQTTPVGPTAPVQPAAPPFAGKSLSPQKPPRPLSVKLPPLRTLAVQPIYPAAPPVTPGLLAAKPAGPAVDIDAVLSNAQREYLMKNYPKAIELARSVQAQSPARSWRIIGGSACGQKDLKLLKESYLKLDQAGRQYLYFVCQRSGISTESVMGTAK